MARSKKSQEMEQGVTNMVENSETMFPESDTPLLLEDGAPEDLIRGAEDASLLEEDILPEMNPADDPQSESEQPLETLTEQNPDQNENSEIPEVPADAGQDNPSEEPPKPKRTTRHKKSESSYSVPDTDTPEETVNKPAKRTAKKRTAAPDVLTIESRAEVETPDEREEMTWHEIHNAYRTRKLLTGTLGGIEQTENGKTIAVVYYKDMRVIIPMKEMMIKLSQENAENYGEMILRQNKILGTMLGAEIDFVVKGIDSKTRSVVASRRDAMLKKRQIFYMGTDADGMYRIYENRIVQARVIAVADKVIRVEIFGVECSIMARDLSWDWLGDAHERFSVGDEILVRVLSVKRDALEDIAVKADVKSVSGSTGRENLSKCRVQGKYAGKVTDIHKGTVFVRLSIGVNAIAHSCYDNRMPGKKDDVSFAVTHIDEERGVAVGIITRIIKQNL